MATLNLMGIATEIFTADTLQITSFLREEELQKIANHLGEKFGVNATTDKIA